MKLVCPGCGTQGSVELFASDVPARQVSALMGRVPPQLSAALLAYLGLFRPASRALTWPRAQTLLEELVPAIEAQAIERGGKTIPTNPAVFKAALEEIVAKRDSLTLPLKSHGYLLEMLRGQAQRAAKGELEQEQIKAAPQKSRNFMAVARANLEAEKKALASLNLPPFTPQQEEDYIRREIAQLEGTA